MYSNAPYAELTLNGASLPGGEPQAIPAFGWATFNVAHAPGTLTARALGSISGPVLANATRSTWEAPAGIILSIDAPSVATGTGRAVYLDGADVALVRATVVDASGARVTNSTLNITFSVTSGPGIVVGVGNGDPGT